MIRTEQRKTNRQGGSFLISLPMPWVKAQGEPDQVHIIVDDVLIVFTDRQKSRLEALIGELNTKVEHLAKTSQAGEGEPSA